MGEVTRIAWCDSTLNFWKICSPVGPGCSHCYAASLSKRFGWGEYAPGVPRLRTGEKHRNLPKKWNDKPFYECGACGHRSHRVSRVDIHGHPTEEPRCAQCGIPSVAEVRRRVFSASLSDWLDNEAPIEWLVDLLDLIRKAPNLDFLLLTKRIGNWTRRLADAKAYAYGRRYGFELSDWIQSWLSGHPPANVWLGITVVNQEEADRDIRKLLDTPAIVRFLSIEPLLSEMNIMPWLTPYAHSAAFKGDDYKLPPAFIDWVIVGGESGPSARPMHPRWVRSLRDQCITAGVPFFFKQWGSYGKVERPGVEHFIDGKRYRGAEPLALPMEEAGQIWNSGKKGKLMVPLTPLKVLNNGQGLFLAEVFEQMSNEDAGNTLDEQVWEQFPHKAAA